MEGGHFRERAAHHVLHEKLEKYEKGKPKKPGRRKKSEEENLALAYPLHSLRHPAKPMSRLLQDNNQPRVQDLTK